MKSTLLIGLLVASILMLRPNPVVAEFVVASNLPTNQFNSSAWEEVGLISPNYNNYNNVSKGQPFTPTLDSTLSTITAIIGNGWDHSVPNSPPLDVSIYTALGGLPFSHLGTKQFAKSNFFLAYYGNNHRETLDLRSLGIQLTAGQQYFVGFGTPYGVNGTTGTDAAYFIGYPQIFLGETAAQARNGREWELFTDPRELAIEVRAIPEPSAQLFSIASFAVCFLRRRKTTS